MSVRMVVIPWERYCQLTAEKKEASSSSEEALLVGKGVEDTEHITTRTDVQSSNQHKETREELQSSKHSRLPSPPGIPSEGWLSWT